VFVDVPMDELFNSAPADLPAVGRGRGADPDPEAVAEVAELLSRAERPLLVLGTDVWADGAEADALAFAPAVDCILMVVEPTTPIQVIERAMELVPKEKFLGFVLNKIKPSDNGYHYYRYGYGKP